MMGAALTTSLSRGRTSSSGQDSSDAPGGSQSLARIYDSVAADRESQGATASETTVWLLGRLPAGRVLEVGCAEGYHLSMLPIQSVGVDISGAALRVAKAHRLEVVRADVNTTLPFRNESFDGVLMLHTLEHVMSPFAALMQCQRVLRPGGWLLVAVPTERSLPRSLVDHYYDDHATHIYAFSALGLTRLAQRAGFHQVKVWFEPPIGKVPAVMRLFALSGRVFPRTLEFLSYAIQITAVKGGSDSGRGSPV